MRRWCNRAQQGAGRMLWRSSVLKPVEPCSTLSTLVVHAKLVEDVTALDGKYVTAGACIHLLTSDAAYLHTPTPNTRHMTPNYNTQHLTCNT